jgi:hypothetical protein
VRYVFLTPHAIQQDIIIPFDQGDREACKPTTVRMRPAFITKMRQEAHPRARPGAARGVRPAGGGGSAAHQV